ncbi:MAG TPA: nuclear transport factor 2 family protein [Terriglobales bacterium]|nr:nuclear transport factor 2 family protein [Terriglobales bacterium]
MPKFSRLLPLLCLALLAGCTVWGEHPVKHWTDVTGGESLERNFWLEVKAHNWTELERHIAGNYVWMSPEGSLDKAAALDHLKQLQLNDYSLGNFRVELNGSTVVVTYTIAMQGSFNGQPVPNTPVQMMSVWQHEKAGWQAIAHTTVVPPAK